MPLGPGSFAALHVLTMAAMGWHEYVGYVGSFLMFSTFWMKTMIPLRIAGITANLAMIVYAAMEGIYPILAVQILMLPLNLYRLMQMRALVLHVAEASAREFQPDALIPFMKKQRFADGHVLFRAGDTSDEMYMIRKGKVRLEELGATLDAGAVFGEIGLVSPTNKRTATAVCVGDTTLLRITRDDVTQLFFQNPEFGFFLIRLVTERLLGNIEDAGAAAQT